MFPYILFKLLQALVSMYTTVWHYEQGKFFQKTNKLLICDQAMAISIFW